MIFTPFVYSDIRKAHARISRNCASENIYNYISLLLYMRHYPVFTDPPGHPLRRGDTSRFGRINHECRKEIEIDS